MPQLTRDGRRVQWEWDEEQGRRGLAHAVEIHQKYDGAHGDLVRCFFSPAQVDTCTPELLQASKARRRRAPAAVAAPHLPVRRRVLRDARAPRQDAGRLAARSLRARPPNTILGHAIVIGGSSWTNYPADDFQILADAGCSVAHAV